MSDEFSEIANNLVSQEANDYLDQQLSQVDLWVEYQESVGEPADLRNLMDKIHHENSKRGPLIIALSAALWRLREQRKK